MLDRLKKYLLQPCPISENRWRVIIIISLFVGLFMLVFQPFGLIEVRSNIKILILLGYALVTFVVQYFVLILFPKVFKNFFHENNWTFLKQYISILTILFLIGIANCAYSLVFFNFNISGWKLLFVFQVFTLLVGFFPVTVTLIISQNLKLKQSLQSANEIGHLLNSQVNKTDSKHNIVEIQSESTKDMLSIVPENICFLSSQGNYVLVYEIIDNELIKKTFRTTLKNIEEKLSDFNFIFRCHRAFVVNLNFITSVKGNAQGIRVTLKNCSEVILVSRNYINDFKNHMALLKQAI